MRTAGTLGLLVSLAVCLTMTACQAQPEVRITTQEGREITFVVELADTPAKRELGLQYRRDLPADRGMIFLFPYEADQTFWMKNTPIPLDMIFINNQRQIVGIAEEAVPFSLDPRSVGRPSQFVLEINGGLSKRYGIKPGNSVRFRGIQAESATQ
ncbi:MAG TPA: DUF192 domain-containing protein [Candidatus Binatia bacterium]